jgi:hypothetical protein
MEMFPPQVGSKETTKFLQNLTQSHFGSMLFHATSDDQLT